MGLPADWDKPSAENKMICDRFLYGTMEPGTIYWCNNYSQLEYMKQQIRMVCCFFVRFMIIIIS